MGIDGIPNDSSAVAESTKNIPEVLECCNAMVDGSQIVLCAQKVSPESWEALITVKFVWVAIMGTPVAQRCSQTQGENTEYYPVARPTLTEVITGAQAVPLPLDGGCGEVAIP